MMHSESGQEEGECVRGHAKATASTCECVEMAVEHEDWRFQKCIGGGAAASIDAVDAAKSSAVSAPQILHVTHVEPHDAPASLISPNKRRLPHSSLHANMLDALFPVAYNLCHIVQLDMQMYSANLGHTHP
jgi:hypothetical protein